MQEQFLASGGEDGIGLQLKRIYLFFKVEINGLFFL